jgi:phosphoribosylaminoimidazole-succinocarboxamide synthase
MTSRSLGRRPSRCRSFGAARCATCTRGRGVRLLLVASDRVSAFDVVMDEPVPYKGAVLTQLTAWWLRQLRGRGGHPHGDRDADEIVARCPRWRHAPRRARGARDALPPHRCVSGRVRGARLPRGLGVEGVRRHGDAGWRAAAARGSRRATGSTRPSSVRPPRPRRGTTRTSRSRGCARWGPSRGELERMLRAARLRQGPRLAGRAASSSPIPSSSSVRATGDLLIDEVLTPDSSRFWPADQYVEGSAQPSFDKQPLRDWLDAERRPAAGTATPRPDLPGRRRLAATSKRAVPRGVRASHWLFRDTGRLA